MSKKIEEAVQGFKETTEIKTVAIESVGIKGLEDQSTPPAEEGQKTFDNSPRVFNLSNGFKLPEAPEQKQSKKGGFYFSVKVEQNGRFVSLPASGKVGKCLREIYFTDLPMHKKGSPFLLKLVFEYRVHYYSKSNSTEKYLGIVDFDGVKDDTLSGKDVEEFIRLKRDISREIEAKRRADELKK